MSGYKEEIWRDLDVEGCGYKYSISSYGRVYNKLSGKYISQVLTGNPQYFYVNLRPVGEDGVVEKHILRRVHNWVGKIFLLRDGENYDRVDHIDQNKFNNSLDNLRWTDRKGNARNTKTNVKFKCGQLLIDCCERTGMSLQAGYDLIRGIPDTTEISWIDFLKQHCIADCGKDGLVFSSNRFKKIQGISSATLDLLLTQGYTHQQIHDRGYKFVLSKKEYLRSVESNSMWYPNLKRFKIHHRLSTKEFSFIKNKGNLNLDKLPTYTLEDSVYYNRENYLNACGKLKGVNLTSLIASGWCESVTTHSELRKLTESLREDLAKERLSNLKVKIQTPYGIMSPLTLRKHYGLVLTDNKIKILLSEGYNWRDITGYTEYFYARPVIPYKGLLWKIHDLYDNLKDAGRILPTKQVFYVLVKNEWDSWVLHSQKSYNYLEIFIDGKWAN